ncbi:hypothetical protein TNCV_1904671 [Trichonephila clavipes]|nr:hypothetical protein TNCV_1904671 [Trichonephila clavipes]
MMSGLISPEQTHMEEASPPYNRDLRLQNLCRERGVQCTFSGIRYQTDKLAGCAEGTETARNHTEMQGRKCRSSIEENDRETVKYGGIRTEERSGNGLSPRSAMGPNPLALRNHLNRGSISSDRDQIPDRLRFGGESSCLAIAPSPNHDNIAQSRLRSSCTPVGLRLTFDLASFRYLGALIWFSNASEINEQALMLCVFDAGDIWKESPRRPPPHIPGRLGSGASTIVRVLLVIGGEDRLRRRHGSRHAFAAFRPPSACILDLVKVSVLILKLAAIARFKIIKRKQYMMSRNDNSPRNAK